MLKYRGINIKKLNKNKEIKFGDFNKNTIYVEADNYIILKASRNFLQLYIKATTNKPIEICNSKHKYTEKIANEEDTSVSIGIDTRKNVIILGSLLEFNCENNSITSLDINNSGLEVLNCRNNALTSLNIDKNINLKTVICFKNKIKNLNVSNNINLKQLDCSNNRLSNLNISKNIILHYLDCNNNLLSILNIDKNINLTYLDCGNNQLNILKVNKNLLLSTLNCSYNRLSTIDVSKNIKLENFFCYNNLISYLDLNNNERLEQFSCKDNRITNLKFTSISTLLDCSNNKLNLDNIIYILKFAINIRLFECNIENNTITDFSKPPELVELLKTAKKECVRFRY